MKIYNSLTRRIEEFKPLNPPRVGMYACGPTVYNYATIGNWRTYVFADTLLRVLKYFGYEVDYIMNITDVGHLTGDNLGDADIGEDRLAKAARRERKTAWEIADFYTKEFLDEFERLNLLRPRLFTKATDHIKAQINLVKRIEKRGFAYKTSDGLYFDVAAYEKKGNTYGELSSLDQIQEGARVEINPEKKDPRDFALWKFSHHTPAGGKKRDMEWDSPWEKGFPGWHIECSAMSIRYLGEQFDIHVGGEDLKSIHHPNEIAQAEASTGKKPFVKYWVHGAFLLVDGGRMGKSLGNAYTLKNIEQRGFDPLDLRYFYLTGHYRKQLNFTWEALEGARRGRKKLNNAIMLYLEGLKFSYIKTTHVRGFNIKSSTSGRLPFISGGNRESKFRKQFTNAIKNDLNMPEALAVVWEVVRSDLEPRDKYSLIMDFDKVLGLKLAETDKIPEEIQQLIVKREELRKKQKWDDADQIRKRLLEKGYILEDTPRGPRIKKKIF